MKKIKCIKCGLRFNDRKPLDESLGIKDPEVFYSLCWNCKFIWESIGVVLKSLSGDNPFMRKSLNREVVIRLEDVIIRKKN